MLLVQNNVKVLRTMSAASPRQIKKGRRRTFSDDFRLQVKQNNDLGTLKKSLSSTLQVSANESLRNISNDLTTPFAYDSSLEDLNRELEKFCPYNESLMSNVANSRYYCDIFSRQSIESGETSSPDFDDENRVNFQADIPETGCEIIVPKRLSAALSINATNYQPCTNVQILKSSCSAFREIAEMKSLQSMSDEETKAAVPSTSKTAEKEEDTDDGASSLAH